ncbi:MAG: DOMON-like domain-containing protein [Sphingomonadaceae bacterium]|nr:DOMON-like domain-containing protein [Sphingomonadaceae bacterium]
MGSIVAELIPHPQSARGAVKSISVGIGRELPDALFVMFKLEGDLGRIQSIDPEGPVERADDLWQTTCFECFIRDAGKAAYREFNLAPSMGWAAYDFASYRQGMTPVETIRPSGAMGVTDRLLTLEALLHFPMETRPRRTFAWRIGLSAVVEETDGAKSYWALAHPPGPPDFHHPDCFALELPSPVAP